MNEATLLVQLWVFRQRIAALLQLLEDEREKNRALERRVAALEVAAVPRHYHQRGGLPND